MTHNLDATVFVYRNHKDKKIKAEYFEKARLLEDSPDWDHIATLEPRIWIEFNYDTIEKQEQEPVAWMEECADFWEHYTYINEAAQEKYNEDAKMWIEKLRTTPQQRTWVGLTDDDLSVCDEDGVVLARYWEAKLKQKNGYAEEKN